MKEHGPIMGQAANLRGGSFIFYPAIGAPHLPSEQATNRQASGVSSRDLFYDSTSALLLRWLICASDPVIRGAKPHLLHSEHRLVIKKKETRCRRFTIQVVFFIIHLRHKKCRLTSYDHLLTCRSIWCLTHTRAFDSASRNRHTPALDPSGAQPRRDGRRLPNILIHPNLTFSDAESEMKLSQIVDVNPDIDSQR